MRIEFHLLSHFKAKNLTFSQRILSSLAVAGVTLLIYTAFVAALFLTTKQNLYGLCGFSHNTSFHGSQNVIWKEYAHPGPGYDGQYYFRLALDPFTDKRQDLGIKLDKPLLRQQRILLPFLAWLCARGNPNRTAIAMLVINLAAIAACAFIAGLLLGGLGIPTGYAFLFGFYPGFAVSLGRFLTEPLALSMIFASLLMLIQRKHLWAASFLMLAVISRETATLLVAAGFTTWLYGKILEGKKDDIFHPRYTFWLYPTLLFGVWQIWLYENWGSVLLNAADNANINIPTQGIFSSFFQNISNFNSETGYYLLMALAVCVFQIFLSRKAGEFPFLLRAAWIFYMLLALCAGPAVWSNSTSFLRVLAELNMLGLLGIVVAKKQVGKPVCVAWFSGWLLSAGSEWYHLFRLKDSFGQ